MGGGGGAGVRQRVRIRHTKRGDLVFLSHHDMMRLWERALRRSGLPVRYSEGFNPRPRYAIPLALGLGIASEDEIFEVELDRWTTAAEVRERLSPELPPEIAITGLDVVGPGESGQVERVDYVLEIPPGREEEISLRLAELRSGDRIEILRERNGKTVDLRPYLGESRCEGGRLWFTLHVRSEGTGRPEELCGALGLDLAAMRPRLTKLRMHLRPPKRPRRTPGRR